MHVLNGNSKCPWKRSLWQQAQKNVRLSPKNPNVYCSLRSIGHNGCSHSLVRVHITRKSLRISTIANILHLKRVQARCLLFNLVTLRQRLAAVVINNKRNKIHFKQQGSSNFWRWGSWRPLTDPNCTKFRVLILSGKYSWFLSERSYSCTFNIMFCLMLC